MNKLSFLSILAVSTSSLAFPSTLYAVDIDSDADVEEIIVTASKMNRKLSDVAGSVSVITADDLEKKMVTDLKQVFKNEPGVYVTGDSGTSQNIIVRGMGGDRVLMIKDGMRMNEGYGANGANDIVGRGFIDMDTIKQVEVAKGPASALYGADAMGGIVVFTTKDASDYLDGDDNLYMQIKNGYAGVNDELTFGGTVAFRKNILEQVFVITKRDGGETQNFIDTRPKFDAETLSILSKTKLNLSENQSINLTIDIWDQETASITDSGVDLGNYQHLEGWKLLSQDKYADRRNESYKLAYHYDSETFESIDISLYENRSSQIDGTLSNIDADGFGKLFIGSRERFGTYTQKTKGLLSNFVDSFMIGGTSNQYAFGFDLEKTESSRVSSSIDVEDNVETKNVTENKFATNEITRTGFYISDYMGFMDDRLSFNIGARYDHYKMVPENSSETAFGEISNENISTNAGIVYKATDNLSLVATYSEGFKVPPYDLAYITHLNFWAQYEIIPTDELVPEESKSYEMGMRFNKEGFNFSVFAYQNNFKNFIQATLIETRTDMSFGFPWPINVHRYENIDRVQIKGIEANVSLPVSDNFQLYANGAVQKGTDRTTGDYIQSVEPFKVTFGGSYTGENYGLDLSMRWAAKMTNVNDGDFQNPGYAVFDMTSYYQVVENMTVRFGVFNILNKEYSLANSVSGLSTGADNSFYTRPKRNFAVSMNVNF